jgi:cell division septum initiation protein DivIVA
LTGQDMSQQALKTYDLEEDAKGQWSALSKEAQYQAAVKYGVVEDNPSVLLQVPEPPKTGDHPWDNLLDKLKVKAFQAFSHANLNPQNAQVLWSKTPNDEKMAWYYKAAQTKVQTTVNLETQEVKVEPAPPPPSPKAKPPTPSPGDLAKAQSPTPYPLYGKEEVDQHIDAFNDKYSGKTLTDPDELAQKVADFKTMYNAMAEAKVKISNELGHAISKKSHDTLEAKLQVATEKYGKENEKRLRALFNLAGASAQHYLDSSKATGELNQVEAALIRGYTSSQFYGSLNEALRNNHGTAAQFTYAQATNAALLKMPTYSGPLWRKTTLPDAEFAKYKVGGAVNWSAFSSSSKSAAAWSGKHTFVITSHSGRDIQKISQHNNEAEVLFPLGTKFEITKIDGNTIHVTEIEKFD